MLIRLPNLGINSLVAETALQQRFAGERSQNVEYDDGIARSVYGYDALDLVTGLNSGDVVLALWQWSELDRTSHLMAHTTEKIYEHDRVNETWADRTQAGLTMNSNVNNPVSWAEMGHDDTNIYLDDNTGKAHAYHHVITSDGGLTNVQRWAGKWETDFADLLGGGGYHDGTTHRCLQVTTSQHNRLLLISPKEYDSVSGEWVDNPQRVRWPTVGKIQVWIGTGSGFYDLFDTGGINVWSARLGASHIIYQTKGIWTLNYVAGTRVFDPRPFIPDLGLQAAHLLVMHNDVHYFMGTDLNIYQYHGGTQIVPVGNEIHKFLIDDLDPDYSHLCWMLMGYKARFLWVGIVEQGKTWPTKVYRRNMITGAWHVRDFSSKFTSGGITAVALAPATSYLTGETYAEALAQLSPFDQSDAGDATVKYGDKLVDCSRALTKDYTAGSWKAGGFDYSKAAENFGADFTTGDMIKVVDGSKATNTRWGTHYYTTYDVSTNGFSVYGTQDTSDSGEHGIADSSTSVPADLSVLGLGTLEFYSVCSFDQPGQTYNQAVEQINTQEKVILGDSTGMVYKYDPTFTDDDGSPIAAQHVTPILDWESPALNKLWEGLRVSAKGGAMQMGYRMGYFETSETGWTDFTFALTTEYQDYAMWVQNTSKLIQFRVTDFSGNAFEFRDFEILEPVILENR